MQMDFHIKIFIMSDIAMVYNTGGWAYSQKSIRNIGFHFDGIYLRDIETGLNRQLNPYASIYGPCHIEFLMSGRDFSCTVLLGSVAEAV